MPNRIQRRRTKGWRAPANTKYVGRGTRWGNPWVIAETRTHWQVNWVGPREVRPPAGLKTTVVADDLRDAHALAVELYEVWLHHQPRLIEAVRVELNGCDLMCWCPDAYPCHADVLIDVASKGRS
ncbi:DUF4326 domain-containing protein [Streptomyces goshikiensis]|uniref:DUF4326 domain-containing protein n=1 Tax=Streptomyces goshikiensis TaxID=1942 RepID=UPI003659AF2F